MAERCSLQENVAGWPRSKKARHGEDFRRVPGLRDQLSGDLTRRNVAVKVQEDFKHLGGEAPLVRLDRHASLEMTERRSSSEAFDRAQPAWSAVFAHASPLALNLSHARTL
jgi:hypothetical protein